MSDPKGPCYLLTRITNSRSSMVLFRVEPWGVEYAMPEEAEFTVISGEYEGQVPELELEVGDDYITLYDPGASPARLFHGPAELGRGLWASEPVVWVKAPTHPDESVRKAQLSRLAKQLQDGKFTRPDEISAVIRTLAQENYVEAKEIVATYLGHDDPSVRGSAIMALAFHWLDESYVQCCLEMIRHDSDSDVREAAIWGLGSLLSGSRDILALKELVPIVRSPTEGLRTRQRAYWSILTILGKQISDVQPFLDEEDWVLRVDWALLSGIENQSL